MYAKSYIDKFFNSIYEYESKVELLRIAYSEFEKSPNTLLNWIVELCEIMNWQAMSCRSGVLTYYDVLDTDFVEILTKNLKEKNEIEILSIYISRINNYDNEELMI
ncbi:hypothetical protein CLPUN_19680 [Clostridium puniceum]|uniref:Uncharacterized protein n=1 Tax=Clostridium puniceum TaxID=29367 RepID=A0A1S8TL79_9CLOT|nr:hypothetical protein [Clostridium puniceum]OOM78359.1 hypothetical protein CLPUN_19680 [Clostridium puniceum]